MLTREADHLTQLESRAPYFTQRADDPLNVGVREQGVPTQGGALARDPQCSPGHLGSRSHAQPSCETCRGGGGGRRGEGGGERGRGRR